MMRVPSGSSKISARSKAQNSPSWLPMGVIFTVRVAPGEGCWVAHAARPIAASASKKRITSSSIGRARITSRRAARCLDGGQVLHEDDVELLLRIARLHLHRDAPADEAREHLERWRLLLQEAVDDVLRGEDAEFARLAEGARLAQDLAQDVVAHGVGGLYLAAAVAGRAGLAKNMRQRFARALARHLDQAEPGEAVDGDPGPVARQRALEFLEHRGAMLLALHV